MTGEEINNNNILLFKFLVGNNDFDTLDSTEQDRLIKELEYDNDWHALMCIVKKVEKLGYDTLISNFQVKISAKDNTYISCVYIGNSNNAKKTKLEATYVALLSFVAWYNKPKVKELSDNELIAEFMEYSKYKIEGKKDGYYIEKYRGAGFPGNTSIANLEFHSSWDWLMPVVEKIESLRNSTGDAYSFIIEMDNADIINTPILIMGGDSKVYSNKIQATYKAVIEFIKWYNKNKKK